MQQIENSHNFHRKAKAGVVAAIAAFALTGAAQAEAAPANSSQEITQAAHNLSERIANHQPVPIDANHQVVWTTKKSKFLFEYDTTAPIKEKVGGTQHYFELVQKGHNLSSINVEPIPASDIRAVLQSPLVYTGVHERGVPVKEIVTSSAVISLNKEDRPVSEVTFNTGGSVETEIGITTNIDKNIITG